MCRSAARFRREAGAVDRYTGPMPSRLLSIRVVLASVVLPALVVAADEAMLAFAYQHRWSAPTTLAVLGWFVVQTGMLSYVAGRWLPNWGWRLVVLCWSMLLINLLLAHAASVGRYINELLALAFPRGRSVRWRSGQSWDLQRGGVGWRFFLWLSCR